MLAAIAWKHRSCTERAKNEAPYSASSIAAIAVSRVQL